ncbi:MAG: extracellular solute-binding protein [Clostridia bacterium]|nr:extracellular solute-binding protein [Clostridia bacterium]
MKKIISFLLCILLAVPAVLGTFSVSAEGKADDFVLSDAYAVYLQQNKDLTRQVDDIALPIEQVVAGVEATEQDETKTAAIKLAALAGEPSVQWINGIGTLNWKIDVKQGGLYNLFLRYHALENGNQYFAIDVLIDGKEPFDGVTGVRLPRLWEDDGKIRKDGVGNEFAPEQREILTWLEQRVGDPEGLVNDPYLFALTAGEHTVTLTGHASKIALSKVALCAEETVDSYADILAGWQSAGYKKYSGKQISIQGEAAALKSHNALIGQSDGTSASVYPNDPRISKINYIGGSNWSGVGDTITWKIKVPQSALYELDFHYEQSYIMNGDSYRQLRVDGVLPFAEAGSLKFGYCNSWKHYGFEDKNGKPYMVYLPEGEHEISLSVTLGDFSTLARALQPQIKELGSLYREIVMITGESPDANRDYELFKQIPDFENRLKNISEELTRVEKQASAISGKHSSSATSIIKSMVAVIARMLKYKYQAQVYKGNFYDNYSSLSAWLYEATNMPLDIDVITFKAPGKSVDGTDANFLESVKFGFLRFCSSLVGDYNNISGNGGDRSITLWINWGRDQAQVLNYLVQSDFTAKTGISVDIKLTNASVIQGLLSGNGPDCYLRLSRTEPVNLAMRGALKDLSEFPNFEDVKKRFMDTATVPYEFRDASGHNGTYALPDGQAFSVLFYRSDILRELGITVPSWKDWDKNGWTWDDFIFASSVIMRNNMQVGLPYTQITDMGQVNMGLGALNIFPTLLMQNGGSLYNKDYSAAELTSAKSVQSFTMWTDFYNKYSFPMTYDFYNRFRVGLMPMAIQSYSVYTLLSGAASEIKGLWDIAPIPGVMQEDGTLNYSQAGSGSGCAVLKNEKHPQKENDAWEFLQWWTGDEIQYRFSQNIESILGITGRHTPATTATLGRMAWEDDDAETLYQQWSKVNEMPEVPGGYYIPRVVDQAFWNVVNNNKSVRSMLLEWDKVADNEIAEKRSQYGLN